MFGKIVNFLFGMITGALLGSVVVSMVTPKLLLEFSLPTEQKSWLVFTLLDVVAVKRISKGCAKEKFVSVCT